MGLGKAFDFIDKMERLRPEQIDELSLRAEAFAPATLLDLQEVARIHGWDRLNAEVGRSRDAARAAEPLHQTCAALDAMGLGSFVDVDLTIVRGLAYYTGIVFELFDAAKTLRAICGGGRYDTLLQELGGVELPALGFGMGDVVLSELLKEKATVPAAGGSVDVFLVFITQDDMPHLLALTHQLRDAGLRVEYPLGPQSVGKQMKLADARGAHLAVVLGPDERARGELVLKDLRSGTQEIVRESTVIDTIKTRIHG
jgi:histidyl-tRNA synthetase